MERVYTWGGYRNIYTWETKGMNWDEYFFSIAKAVALKSKDTSNKAGCVLVDEEHGIISTGYNDFPRRVKDTISSRRERPIKYIFTQHAEENAIADAARQGKSTNGSTAYVWSNMPVCGTCTGTLINAGIKVIVGSFDKERYNNPLSENEALSIQVSRTMIHEAKIDLREHLRD